MKNFKKLMCMFVLALLLTVTAAIPSEAATIKLNHKSVTLLKKQTVQLKVSGTKKKVTWKTSKKSVATVSSKGKVTAKKTGSATITAKVSGKTLTCKVKVENPALSRDFLIINQGDTYQLKLDGASGKPTWKVGKKAYATVDKNGVITASTTEQGYTYVKATYKGKSYECKLKVTNCAENYKKLIQEIKESPRKDADGNPCLYGDTEIFLPTNSSGIWSTISYLEETDTLKFVFNLNAEVYDEGNAELLGYTSGEYTAVMYMNLLNDDDVECKTDIYLDDEYIGGTGSFNGKELEDTYFMDFDTTCNDAVLEAIKTALESEDPDAELTDEYIDEVCDSNCQYVFSEALMIWSARLYNDVEIQLGDLGMTGYNEYIVWSED